MNPGQRRLCDVRSPDCLFGAYLANDDHHCNDLGMGRPGYKVIGEDHPDLGKWLAEVRWIDINDVRAKDIPLPPLPAYISTITSSSAALFTKYQPAMVAVKLGDVVSTEKLQVADSLERRFGIPPGTPVLLQCYAKDRLLENIWPKRHEVFPKLAQLGFCAVTGLNYSVWGSHPHAERLINIKRAHLTFEDWQALGVPAIPHMYWCSYVNLDAWLQWLEDNPSVRVMALDMQTMRKNDDWERALAGLKYFVGKLKRPIHFLITGPCAPHRVSAIKQLLPSLTLTNGSPARKAFASNKMMSDSVGMQAAHSNLDKSLLFQHNTTIYEQMLEQSRPTHAGRLLAKYRRERRRSWQRKTASVIKEVATV